MAGYEEFDDNTDDLDAIKREEEERKKEFEILSDDIEKVIANYEGVLDLQVNFHVHLGATRLSLFNFLRLTKGSIINLEKAAGEGANFCLNDRMIGKGEIMVYEKNLAIRINEVLSHDAIIYYFYSELMSE